jgi:hypothetical protein
MEFSLIAPPPPPPAGGTGGSGVSSWRLARHSSSALTAKSHTSGEGWVEADSPRQVRGGPRCGC